ncbi:hypothetical protein [Ehrlichia ruminantium]|uniref:Uncharacterized protein n=1 Tax=Ehrlichia ruminantium (strain Welgevonden) TaxID=254945 RepID=A0A0H3M015_EHRRW|nr:hypothetical protein [Ehrlichia ruminantium]QLK55182.1 hypothetical protein FDZ62_02850 [Ehrlichia ruminantium]QLK56099.1 hypothetical protein FDZ61_02845 [Ehrlichia ruminantium]UOD99310.1 hypothetical protein IMW62_02840 [Ehrlichia ruminantium]CAH58234.1 putative integral membrane protein [Ehrlichia ruminantium str. Welgevonden]CAI27023.1 Hypothetical protein ERWE_CDS_05290 [Ehrlichia ruminantium str. Welgevonden]
MPLLKNTARTAGVVGSFACLIFVGNVLMRYFCNKNSNAVIAVMSFLSVGIVMFFSIYGSNKDPLTFTKFKVYGILLASALIMFCITNIILRKESVEYNQLKKQKQSIHALEVKIINLKIRLSAIKRETELHFSGFASNDQICTDIQKECLLPRNMQYYDYYASYRVINLIIFSIALLIFLSQSFHSAMFEMSDLTDLFLYGVMVSCLLIMFLIDQLLLCDVKNELKISEQDYPEIKKSLNDKFVEIDKQYCKLVKEISDYNMLSSTKITEANVEKLEKCKSKILSILNQV